MNTRCFGCMKLKQNHPICEHCGFDERSHNNKHQLPVGTEVGGQYILGRVLGQGGFGITYIGWDKIMNQAVAVKEYFPTGFAGRDTNDFTVTSYDDRDKHTFESNKKRFLREAESLGKLWNIPQIVRILRCFEENGTAYIAMEYVEGMDLRRYLKQLGRPMTMTETMAILGPVMEALEHVHKSNLVHRDISPDNIMVLPDGSAKLLDFGAARYVENADANHDRATSTQAILKHGFAPPEQYSSHGALGPWTDVYAMCATIYYCLTGRIPPEAMSRVMEDAQLDLDTIPDLGKKQKSILEKGLAVLPKERFASAAELWMQLKPAKKEANPAPKKAESASEKAKKVYKKRGPLLAGIAAVISAIALVGILSGGEQTQHLPPSVNIHQSVLATQEESTAAPTEPELEIITLLELEDGQLEQTRQITVLSDHDPIQLTWSSDDPKVATISSNGTITVVGYGKAEITAAYAGQAVICTVYVDPVPNVTCTFEENETGLTITGYEGTLPEEMILPRKIDGKTVTAIADRAFSHSDALISVFIPEDVETIDIHAFIDCSALTQVSLPRRLTPGARSVFGEHIKYSWR